MHTSKVIILQGSWRITKKEIELNHEFQTIKINYQSIKQELSFLLLIYHVLLDYMNLPVIL